MATTNKRKIWGWMAFDWASQPFYTLGLTFIFGPYFAEIATQMFMGNGLDSDAAKAQSQSTWAFGQTIAGLIIALSAPFLGAFADAAGRRIPWIALFSVIYVAATFSLWFLAPDGSNLILILLVFYVGFIASESTLNFINAILPSLGTKKEVGRISGSGAAFGYWGGVLSLALMLLFFAESATTGKTMIGLAPMFGLDPEAREGTRAVGPFIAIWYAIFIIPFFLFVRDDPALKLPIPRISKVWSDLKTTLSAVAKRKSLGSFLLGSMFYRDALNALYVFGGVYAGLVLGWPIQDGFNLFSVGVFGVVSAIAAAVFTYIGGRFDAKLGPKPVIIGAVLFLIFVSTIIVGMSRTQVFGVPIAADSNLPDIIFFTCGVIIGGAGGALYSASRSLMVRHTEIETSNQSFGLFALSGKATAFLAPFLIGVFTAITGNVQLGFLPVIFLFILGLILLTWVNKDGDLAQ
jgi:UMF1 family MFS transporter